MSPESNGDTSGFPGFSRILALMFGVGAYALLAQVLLLREFLVVFFGNELTIGAVFGAWLALIGAGSLLASLFVERWPAERLRVLLVVLLTLSAVLLPCQVGAIRIVRAALHVAYGEYVPFLSMLSGLAAILAPGCLIIGITFPCACRLAARPSPLAVSRVYMIESLGSMAAGAAFSFWLVRVMSPLAVAALAGAIILLGAAWLANTRICRWLLGLLAFVFAVGACCPVCLAPLERASVEARWRSFGALPSSGSSTPSASRLLASCDSRYQNLALIETEGQMALYANGQVMSAFPDAVIGEHKIHFVMAQKPDARRVLLIGGNPIDDIPELLKYPLEQLVYVELDEEIGRLLEPVATSAYLQALRDPRLMQVHMDAPRYVKQYGCRGVDAVRQNRGLPFYRTATTPEDRSGEMARREVTPYVEPQLAEAMSLFDAIMVDASEPATIALNRFYTQEFYRDIRRILSPGGFLYTAVAASDDLQGGTAYLSASIYAALRAVFGCVLVTAGTKNQFFAGAANSPITLARTTLFQRSAKADIKTRYFRPEYFLNTDDISPEKLDFVEKRLAAIPVAANTVLKPVSTFYQIALWSRFSGSGLESLLARLTRLRIGWVAAALLGFGVVCLGMGALLGRKRVGSAPRFSRGMLLLVMAASGLCGMALELILIFVFQALLGYLYAKVGLIVAMFMLGLTLGALGCVPTLKRSGQWGAMITMEILLIAEAACIPWLMNALSSGPMIWIPWGWVETLIYGLIAGSGALVGAQFALVNELMSRCEGKEKEGFEVQRLTVQRLALEEGADTGQDKVKGGTAALANAADLAGAALGGLVVGVLLLPLFGITSACFLLAILKLSSLLCLLAAQRAACVGQVI